MAIISFEGIDGCGKTTQVKLLEEYLKKQSIPTISFREPGGCSLAEDIRTILLRSKQSISGVTEFLLFSAARAQLVREKIIPALQKGKWIILDRYFLSSIAYQGYGRDEIEPDILEEFSKYVINNIYPDMVFYIKIDEITSQKRTNQRLTTHDRIEQENDDFFFRVIEGYNKLIQKYPKQQIHIIDGTNSIKDIHNNIINLVCSFLPISS